MYILSMMFGFLICMCSSLCGCGMDYTFDLEKGHNDNQKHITFKLPVPKTPQGVVNKYKLCFKLDLDENCCLSLQSFRELLHESNPQFVIAYIVDNDAQIIKAYNGGMFKEYAEGQPEKSKLRDPESRLPISSYVLYRVFKSKKSGKWATKFVTSSSDSYSKRRDKNMESDEETDREKGFVEKCVRCSHQLILVAMGSFIIGLILLDSPSA